MHKASIFHDPSGRRQRRVNIVLTVLITLVTTVAGLGVWSITHGPRITPGQGLVSLSDETAGLARAFETEGSTTKERRALESLGSRPLPKEASTVKRLAYFDIGDPLSHVSLAQHAKALDGIIGNFLIIDQETRHLRQTSRETEERVRRKLARIAPDLGIYVALTTSLPQADTAAVLASPELRRDIKDRAVKYVQRTKSKGLVLSLRGLPEQSAGYLFDFTNSLALALKAEGAELIVTGHTAPTRASLQDIARIADKILVTNEIYVGDPAVHGAPQPQQAFEAALKDYASIIPAERLLVVIGAFACERMSYGDCEPTPVKSVWRLAARAKAPIALDRATLNSRVRLVDGVGRPRDFWLLDAASVFNAMRASLSIAPGGLVLKRLGQEDPSAWTIFAKGARPDAETATALHTIPSGRDVEQSALESEIIAGSGPSREGTRTLDYEAGLGLITSARLEIAPEGSMFQGWTAPDHKKLAITFDDGPDDEITPKVLDVLKEKGVPATFFVIGRNALSHPDILRRIDAEGHDIGNHTFSHPRLSEMTPFDMRVELNATQRVLEFILGRHTRLFRPPYNGSAVAGQPDNVSVLQEASSMGYTTVLSSVDGGDWLAPSANLIHDRIVSRVLRGDGQIILLHDFGKKTATVEALSRLIDTLHAKGYQFVTMHDMLGETRESVLQVAGASDLVAEGSADGGYIGILAYQAFGYAIMTLAVMVVVLNLARLIFALYGTYRHKKIERAREGHRYWPKSVAVIVPAYNEERVICKTIHSIFEASCTDFEVIVVDDGSSDDTAGIVRRTFAADPRVKVFKKPNGGKAEASNFALRHTDAEVVIALDADGVLDRRAIELMVRHFEDPKVGAVAGTAIVGNTVNLLTRFQSLEYMVGQYLDRRALTLFNANAVVPGAIGAWRRTALLGVGGYATDTVAEDCDATISVARAGWTVVYEPEAEAWTEAPETLQGFLKQRRRWMFGMLQVVRKHIDAVKGRPANIGWLTLPHVMIFGFFVSFATPILSGVFIYQCAARLLALMSGSADPDFQADMALYMKWWAALSLFDLIVITGILHYAGVTQVVRKIPLIILQRLIYLPVIYWVGYETVLHALKGRIVGWNKLKRTGAVSLRGLSPVSEQR